LPGETAWTWALTGKRAVVTDASRGIALRRLPAA
jgi:hypothetical protein